MPYLRLGAGKAKSRIGIVDREEEGEGKEVDQIIGCRRTRGGQRGQRRDVKELETRNEIL